MTYTRLHSAAVVGENSSHHGSRRGGRVGTYVGVESAKMSVDLVGSQTRLKPDAAPVVAHFAAVPLRAQFADDSVVDGLARQ